MDNYQECVLIVLAREYIFRLGYLSEFFLFVVIFLTITLYCRSQWPRGLRRRCSGAHLLILWVRIPPGTWMSVCCGCCVLSGRDLCDGLIIRSEESYRLWSVVVCDLETSNTRRLKPATGL